MFDFLIISKRTLMVFGTAATMTGGSGVPTVNSATYTPPGALELVMPFVPANASEASEPVTGFIRIDMPVAWQLTRVRTSSSNPSMVTESFRELWTIEQRPGGAIFLNSPRARVSAYALGGGNDTRHLTAAWPKLLMLSETAFARLVGLPPPSEPGESETLGSLDRLVTLALHPAPATSEVTLHLSEDQTVEIQMEIGTQVLF